MPLPGWVPMSGLRIHSGYVAGLAFRLLGRDGDVDDLVQDVFLEATRGLETLKDAGAVRAWLATLTVRLAGRRIRRKRIASFLGFGDEGPDAYVVSPEASPEQRVLLVLVALKARFGVGDVRVHTGLLFDSATMNSCPICKQAFLGSPGLDVARYTLQQLALHGQGNFTDPGSPQQLTLSALDATEFTTFCP